MTDGLWKRWNGIKTPSVSAIRERRASVCLSVLCIGRGVNVSPFSKDEENDDDGDGVTDGGLYLLCMVTVR